MKHVHLMFFLCFCVFFAQAEVEFKNLDLSNKDELLFTARTDLPGQTGYETAFVSDLSKGTLEQLTFYPEEISLLDDADILQIQNRFGVFRSSSGLSGMKAVEGFPAFARGSQVQEGKIISASASPDGAYLLYIVPTSNAFGRLMLLDVKNSTDTIIAQSIEYSIRSFPASWSKDSEFFVYEKAQEIYYYSMAQFEGKRISAESYRKISPGRVNCVRWSDDGNMYLINENLLYRIKPAELFTRTLYAGIISVGTIVGKVPFPYEPNFDSFFVSPDGNKMLFNKEGRNIFLFYVNPDDFSDSGKTASLPYLFLPANTRVLSILWPETDSVTVITESLLNGTRQAGAYRIDIPRDRAGLGLAQSFKKLDESEAKSAELSPDKTKIAVINKTGVSIRKYSDWSLIRKIDFESPIASLWKNNEELVISGGKTVELCKISDGSKTLISISQVDAYGFSKITGKVQLQVQKKAYERVDGAFKTVSEYLVYDSSNARDNKRVYLDSVQAGSYKNTIMVRSVSGLGTTQLILPGSRTYKPFPDKEDDRNDDIFDHGSRIRRREVALVFNLIDTQEGLTSVLNVLKDYDLSASFFVNGEFIRRNPGAIKEIAASGHEIGSLFFSNFDLTDSRYKLDSDFIKRGLARNEDEYFEATGRELSLIWHAPNYVVSEDIVKAGKSMNYTYIGRDVEPMDWISEHDSFRLPGSYFPAHVIVERIISQKKPGSIIPIRIGIPPGGRVDYLYNELDLVINALINEGYSIVSVSTLIEHTK